ncbi:MAG: SCO family protein [Cognatishimia sp.]|uniref:SCO family protein n=1 Tax=Cognatishimia sp. TaxID=2211648 RepID=UPI00405A3FEE
MNLSRRTILLVVGSAISGFVATIFVGWWQVDGVKMLQPREQPSALPLPFYQMDFTLTDHTGRKVVPQNWVGRPTLVFFGFTYCPDVCPTTLMDISGWLEALGDEASQLQAVFVTVDPGRDTIEVIAEYMSNFHPNIIGYVGTSDELSKAAKSFRVIYEKLPTEGQYTMNHTASIFIYNSDGKFISTIDYHESRANAALKIKRAINN